MFRTIIIFVQNLKIMKKAIFLFILSIFILPLSAQEKGLVKWYTVNDIEKLLAKEPRPVFIDAFTDWCGWCKRLDQNTFSDPVIAKYLNENFYPVKFNAESKDPVTFMGKEYINDGKYGKTHSLAAALLPVNGQIGFPTIVFLNEKGELITPVQGYKEPKDFEPLLVYFGKSKYLTESWQDFNKTFKGSY